MWILILVSTVFILCLCVGGSFKYKYEHPADSSDLETILDAKAQRLIKNGQSSGIVIGVYQKGLTFVKGYGVLRNFDDCSDADYKVFEIASLTKLFTVGLLQVLSDEGAISLDFKLGEVLGDRFPISPQLSKITLRELATHSSGLPNLPKAFIEKSTNPKNPYANLTMKNLTEYLQHPTGLGRTGKFLYSNLGVGLLGYVIENITGESLDSTMHSKIFTPIGMRMTGFSMNTQMIENFVSGHSEDGRPTQPWDMPVIPAAGALKSNADDMLKFIKANIDPGGSVSTSLRKIHPTSRSQCDGLGWFCARFIDRLVGNEEVIWHNGRVGGHASYIAIDHENDIGIIILSNRALDITISGVMMMRAVRIHTISGLDKNTGNAPTM